MHDKDCIISNVLYSILVLVIFMRLQKICKKVK